MLRVAFGLLFCWMAQAQPMGEAAGQLAGRIFSLLQRRTTVSFEFQNLTPIAPVESSTFRTALEEELRKLGLETAATGQPEFRLRVTVSENARGLLFVAEALSGDNRKIIMLPWGKPPRAGDKPRVKLLRKPIWEQAEPLLDFLLLDSGSQLLVLSPSKVSSYRLVDGKWAVAGIAALFLARPLPRDPRGRIQSASTGFRVYVSGTTCSGMLQPALKLDCAAGNEAWPVDARDSGLQARWLADRSLLESAGVRSAFYTAGGGLFAAADGRIQDRAGETLAGAESWGSDLASIVNPCGASSMVLATKSGDGAEQDDQLRAYEIVKGQAAQASDPEDLPGPVTALWPAEGPGQATLVVKNLKTGNYEASLLGLACLTE